LTLGVMAGRRTGANALRERGASASITRPNSGAPDPANGRRFI